MVNEPNFFANPAVVAYLKIPGEVDSNAAADNYSFANFSPKGN
jgi:hypothetical protein